VPLLDGAAEYARMGIIPAGAYANRKHYGQWLANPSEATVDLEMLISDPQTSGGLLIAATPKAVEAIALAM
jgi:selenide,water dikinase